ncbi:ubiquinol-cytochrome c reductase iron-sulfur subunit [Ahniella affigens]|uniref:Ubiquinol-cytochrome c reductase iron-sulfur subunit n=1 Tax=Ahniella affigens TaxID=2021234 RepID=A0A2P1PTN3_9GAMM|nr:ubiquinol-cytochrome c reductase iron-sulfur subunit [Ahniella affigens]AVP98199.1 ubiquinol-cytochrome c reductase iron-sulfur subunit [Ahniella affigens]
MAEQGVDKGRRRFLTASTAIVGGIGGAFAAVPFVKSWTPSAKAQTAGAPVLTDISKLEMNARKIEMWRGKPVWIIRRSQEVLDALPSLDSRLRDPDSTNEEQTPEFAKNAYRSIRPEILVLEGVCTHLGCSPLYYPEMIPQGFDTEWKGGFYCPCHQSRFDSAGRVFQGVPAPSNLRVPPYHFVTDTLIEIGVKPAEGAAA